MEQPQTCNSLILPHPICGSHVSECPPRSSTSDSSLPNFLILLIPDADQTTPSNSVYNLSPLLLSINIPSDDITFRNAALCFREWSHARAALKSLWEIRLRRDSNFWYVPVLQSNIVIPPDEDGVVEELTPLFVGYLKEVINGKEVCDLLTRYDGKDEESRKVNRLLSQPKRRLHHMALTKMRKNLSAEQEMILRHVKEFKASINCLLRHLEGEESDEFDVFCFEEKPPPWEQIHRCVLREIKRMKDGLPLYIHRKDILQHIKSSQVTMVIGETGSGKSTQILQYLADSRVAASGAIVCTQPRKMAAMALADELRSESVGCYLKKSVVLLGNSTLPESLGSNLVYTTDDCLLHLYMNDNSLSSISCIIIDEAQERSVSTDLLLVLIRDLLFQRPHLRLVIMSATTNSNQLSHYFFGCRTLQVSGRTFPVVVKYKPSKIEDKSLLPSYVTEAINVVAEIHQEEEEGTVLSFLTSQSEVEWACWNFKSPNAVVLPLHEKLMCEEQNLVLRDYPGKRKVIFSTNIAETSLIIPEVKYVVDCGFSKQRKFENSVGTNSLCVSRISQSSARQRASIASWTSPGKCYRLYSEQDFNKMMANDEPEILRVHLEFAVLRILALTNKSLKEFNFIDTPSAHAIDAAMRSLLYIGAVRQIEDKYELTKEGHCLVKLGIEPRLAKIILDCNRQRLGKEGLVLAAVIANSNNIFCQVGSTNDKFDADRVKVKFCHPDGDLFTLMSVFREWESLQVKERGGWCSQNRINSKTMDWCLETVHELESCLKKELCVVISNKWSWSPLDRTECHTALKEVILCNMIENVAMYSGSDNLGYEVALTSKYKKLHPSCSLHAFGKRPSWVVFGEILSVSEEFLVCVSAVDYQSLISIPRLFNIQTMRSRKMEVYVVTSLEMHTLMIGSRQMST